MSDLIRTNYRGATITIAITGLPITITGTVVQTENTEFVSLKLEDGRIVNITESLIAFFY